MSWLLTLLACKQPDVIVVGGRHTDVSVRLVDPTGCVDCDPFAGVDTLRIEVWRDGVVVATDSFAYPDETPELPDLEGFGVVRIALVGLSDGDVVSAGRTAEVALVPDAAQEVPMVFLPANEAISIAAPMGVDRSRHAAARLADGSVLLVGGVDRERARAWDGMERYDPATGTFTEVEAKLPGWTAEPRLGTNPAGELFVVGGFVPVGGAEVAVPEAARIDPVDLSVLELGALNLARTGHCFALYREKQGVVLGGTTDTEQAEYFRQTAEGDWGFTIVPVRGLQQEDVAGCATLPDGRVFVQGADEISTGVWTHLDDETPGEAFRRMDEQSANLRFARGPMVAALADGRAWVGGGEGTETGEVEAEARLFDAGERRFGAAEPLAVARYEGRLDPWIVEDWAAIGCGWEDAARATPADTLELVHLATGDAGPVVRLDRSRPGCAVTTLNDGSVLITGGQDASSPGTPTAALVVVWPDL